MLATHSLGVNRLVTGITMGWIYIFFCLVDYKVYIGKWTGKRIEDRRNEHKRGGGNQPLYNAIQKHGWDNFIFDTLHYVSKEQLIDLEIKEIARFNCNRNQGGWGYNLTDGGEGMLGNKQSAETLQKRSEAMSGENHPNYGKPLPVETRQKISESQQGKYDGENNPMYGLKGENHPKYGKVLTAVQRQNISEGKTGTSHTIEARQKMSDSTKGENNPFWGKQRPDHSAKMTGAGNPFYGKTGENHPCTRPEYSEARMFFFIELANMEVKDKRKRLYEMFAEVPRRTLYDWINKWQKELS